MDPIETPDDEVSGRAEAADGPSRPGGVAEFPDAEASVEAPPASPAGPSTAVQEWGAAGTSEWISSREIFEPMAEVIAQHGPSLLGIALLLAAPGYALLALAGQVPGASISTSQSTDMLPILINSACLVPLTVLFALFAGAVAVVSLAARHGRPVSVLGAVFLSLSRGAGVVVGGGVAGVCAALAWGWPSAFMNQYVRVPPGVPTPEPTTGLYVFGFVVLVVGVFVAMRLAFTGAVGVIEGRGDAMVASWEMTRPHMIPLLIVVLPLSLGATAAALVAGSVLRQINVPAGFVDLLSLVIQAAASVFPVLAVTEIYMLSSLRSPTYTPSTVLALLPSSAESAEPSDAQPLPSPSVEAPPGPPWEGAFSSWFEARTEAERHDRDELRAAWMDAVNNGQAWIRDAGPDSPKAPD